MPSHFVESLATIDLSKVEAWEVDILRGEFEVRCEGRFATFKFDGEFPRADCPHEPAEVLLVDIFKRNALSLTLLWEMWSNETFEDDEGWRLEYEAWWAGVCEAAERADIPLGNRSSEHSARRQ